MSRHIFDRHLFDGHFLDGHFLDGHFLDLLLHGTVFRPVIEWDSIYMKNTYCLFQVKFITEYTNVQQDIITQILLKQFN